MQTIAAQLDTAFRQAITAAFGLDADPLIAVAGNDKFGDYQSNAAMGLAKELNARGQKTNPRAVAEQIKSHLQLGDIASEVGIAGPGFLNVRLNPAWLEQQLASIAADERLGIDAAAQPRTVVVDYSGPNVAKQMHVGHLRSTIIGDAISRVIEFQGHQIIRQNHIGDWGTQFGRVVLAMWYAGMTSETGRSAELNAIVKAVSDLKSQEGKIKETEPKTPAEKAARDELLQPIGIAVGDQVKRLGKLHQSLVDLDPTGEKHFEPYLQHVTLDLPALEGFYQFVGTMTEHPVASEVKIQHPTHGVQTLEALPRLITLFIQDPKKPENAQERLAWLRAREVTLVTCQEIYSRLAVKLAEPSTQSEPLVRGESFYNDFLPDVVRDLKTKGLAVESQGAVIVPVEGFEAPLIIEKTGGGYLYATTDLAGVRFRVGQLHANRIIYTHDSRQAQHFAQVFATAKKAGWADGVELEYAPFGTMLGPDGKPFKTRSGGTVKLKELLDEAEERAFGLVTTKNPELPESQRKAIASAVGIGGVKYADLSKDRTSDYLFSWETMLNLQGNTAPYLQYVYARIKSIFRKAAEPQATRAFSLTTPHELALAKHLLRLGEVIEIVARELKPHHLTAYLYELAVRFSGFYENCPVLQSDEPLRSKRLALCDVTARSMALGLDLLGIAHPEQM